MWRFCKDSDTQEECPEVGFQLLVTLCWRWTDLWPVCDQNIHRLKQKEVHSNSIAPSVTCLFSQKLRRRPHVWTVEEHCWAVPWVSQNLPWFPRADTLRAHTQAAALAHIFIGCPFTSHQRVASHSLDPGTPNNCLCASLRSRPQWLTLNNVSSHTQPVSVLTNVCTFHLLSVEHMAFWHRDHKARVKEFLSFLWGNSNLNVYFGGFLKVFFSSAQQTLITDTYMQSIRSILL